jgi:rubrerythrin
MYQREYEEVVNQLDKTKKKLIELRNSLFDTVQMMKEIENVIDESNKKIKKLKTHVCPECGSKIEDTLIYRSKQYNLIEDAITLKNDLQVSLIDDRKSIEKEEAKYKELLEKMASYEDKMKINSKEIDDVLRFKGLSELKGDVISNREDAIDDIESDEKKLKEVETKIRAYAKKKKKIEDSYYEEMVTSWTKLGIKELSPDTFKKLTNTVKASGSNKNVVTLMWYLTILKLRKKYNPDAIEFPIAFDSINNVETDNVKKVKVLQYVIDNTESSQLILSLLGYNNEEVKTDRPVNIIKLTNDKYQLLDTATYNKYEQLLDEFCNAQ